MSSGASNQDRVDGEHTSVSSSNTVGHHKSVYTPEQKEQDHDHLATRTSAASPPRTRKQSSPGNSTDEAPALDLDEMARRAEELQRSPTQQEIDALMAEYELDSESESEDDQDSHSHSHSTEEADADGHQNSRLHTRHGSRRFSFNDELEDDDTIDHMETVIMKVLVVGNARCGKTSTIRRYVTQEFADKYTSTIGADFTETVLQYDASLRLHLELWDIAGQDRFAKLTRAYFREARGALVVCDLTRENTISAVETWKRELDVCCHDLNDGREIPVVLVANKCDLLQDPVSALDLGVAMEKCVARNGIVDWFRASAKSGERVNDAFACLVDRMVLDHRQQQQQQQQQELGSSTSSASASDHDSDDGEATHRIAPLPRDDIIRLSHYSPHIRNQGQQTTSGCDCN